MNFYKHYIGDFQRDTGHLSLTERGAYLCLMHHYYATEKPLPNDESALCRIAGAIAKSEREAVRAAMSFFMPVESGLMHPRIEAELAKAGKQADTNRQIAIEREAARKAARTEHEQSTNRATNRSPNQTPDTKEYIEAKASHPDKPGKVREFPPGFDAFWSVYPRKVGKDAAAKAFAKRRIGAELLAVVVAAVEAQKHWPAWTKDAGQFIPHPATWLTQGRWQDEAPQASGDDLSELFRRGQG